MSATMRNGGLLLLLSFSFFVHVNAAEPSPAQVADESKRLNDFFQKAFEEFLARNPVTATQIGSKLNHDKWNDLSDAAAAQELSFALARLAEMRRDFDPKRLNPQARLSYQLFERAVEDQAAGFRFRRHNFPVNQMHGWHTMVPSLLMNQHRIDTSADADAYVARLRGVQTMGEQLLVTLRERAERGIVPPKFVYPLVLDACHNIISGRPFDSAERDNSIFADFKKKVGALKDLEPQKRDQLIKEAEAALKEAVAPAYQALIAFLEEQEKTAPAEFGAWKLPDGRQFYEGALRRTTTTNLSADEIHDLGLREITRIHGEMNAIKQKIGFGGDLPALFRHLREDKQFYLPESEAGKAEYLKRAVNVIDTMKGRLDELFLTKPKADVVVKAVEKFREKSAGKAFYERPATDGSRPGMFYVNLADMSSTPIYELEALAYHEGIPGHHMQLALAQELEGIPMFRKLAHYTAYIEGWGLYSELIPKEIGFYQDPWSDLGRLAMELWRAARLVVDTGIHHKRWTRQQAVDYLKTNTPNSESDCVEAANRYTVMPSQATAYKIGMIKIVELREHAKKELGEKFDLRQFHEVVLSSGPVPLQVLEELVNRWIESKRA